MADPATLKLEWQLDRPGILFSLARQDDSTQLVIGNSQGTVFRLDAAAEKPEAEEFVGHTSYVTGVAMAGEQIVSGGYDGNLIWWDADTRQPKQTVKAHSRWIRDVVATPDGRYVVSVADDMVCRIWNATTATLVRDLYGHAKLTPHEFPSMLYTCAISSDGRFLATGDRIGKTYIWELNTGRLRRVIDTPIMYTWDGVQRIHSIGGVRSVAFSHDSKLLAVGGIGTIGNIDHLDALARVEVFDWRKSEKTHEFAGDTHKGLVEKLAFDPTNSWIVAAGGDHGGFIQLLDLSKVEVLKQEKAPMHIHDFHMNAAADTIYGVGHGKIVRWQMTS